MTLARESESGTTLSTDLVAAGIRAKEIVDVFLNLGDFQPQLAL